MLTDQQIVAFHDEDRSVYSLAKEFGLPSTSLRRRFIALGLSVSHRKKIRDDKVKDHIDEILALHAQGLGRGEIARKIGCEHTSISRLLKKHGLGGTLNNKTHSADESFFDEIDTEAKAYTLGFITADGCNCGNSLQISVADRDIIEKIRDAMGHTGPVRVIPPKGKVKQTQYEIRVCSTRVCDALTLKGCPRRKSLITRFPTPDIVPPHLLRHYIRGVFDGDGSLYRTTNGWHFGVAGTEALLSPMFDLIRRETGIVVGGVYAQGKISVLKIPGIKNATSVLNWLYQDSSIYMDRKKNLFLKMCQEHKRGR